MSNDNVVNIFKRALTPTDVVNLSGSSEEIRVYLDSHVLEHPAEKYLKSIVNPLLSKLLCMDPSLVYKNIHYVDKAIAYSLYIKLGNLVSTMTIDIFGSVDEAYPDYKEQYGPIVQSDLEDTLRTVGCMEPMVRFCATMADFYRHTLNHSFFVNYDPGSFQLIIPINKEMTIDITISAREILDEETIQ